MAPAIVALGAGLGALYTHAAVFLVLGGPYPVALFFAPKALMYWGWPLTGGCLALGRYFRPACWAAAAIFAAHVLGALYLTFTEVGSTGWGGVADEWRERAWFPFAALAYYGIGLGTCVGTLLKLRTRWQTANKEAGPLTPPQDRLEIDRQTGHGSPLAFRDLRAFHLPDAPVGQIHVAYATRSCPGRRAAPEAQQFISSSPPP